MQNQEKAEFLAACKSALESEDFIRVTFTGEGKNSDKFRCKIELLKGEKRKFLTYSDNRSGDDIRLEHEVDNFMKVVLEPHVHDFKAALLSTNDHDLHYAQSRKGKARVYRAKPSMKGVVQTHNRTKNYVLDRKRPYLKGLGIASPSGEIIKKSYSKFRQIANFVEIIDRDIGEFVESSSKPISLLDLGCGKGYLTFAAYDYLRSRAKVEPDVVGIDIKSNVIDLCNDLAGKLQFGGLNFKNARIHKNQNEDIDILVALHACDTATDDALALGLRSNMKYVFCAPCCQAEIAQQLKAEESNYGVINGFPLMRRRQADILTDVCRALLLKAFGYDVKFLEFTPLEHTSKNVLLVGKKSTGVDRQGAFDEYLALKKSSGFSHHALEHNIGDLIRASALKI